MTQATAAVADLDRPRPHINPDFEKLLPPLSLPELEALKADIEANGVTEAIAVDEEGQILDGHHRFKIRPDAPFRVLPGLPEEEKLAFVIRANLARRNLSPEQKREVGKQQRAIAKTLRAAGKTQEQAATLVGVTDGAVSQWEAEDAAKAGDISISSARVPYTPPPKLGTKVPPTEYERILERLDSGETQAQVAADYGVTQPRVSSIATKERKQRDKRDKRKKQAKETPQDPGLHLGDFRELWPQHIEPGTVDLVFTDPPYAEKDLGLYRDLGLCAKEVLRPGGVCLAYSGNAFLPQATAALMESLEYAWTCAVRHTGGELRFRKFKVANSWKPVVMLYRPPLDSWWDWFTDLTTGGKEKDEHEWQQAEGEAKHYLKALCPPAGIVLDPMCGSGTTLVAAKKLKLRYIGFEREQKTYEEALLRVSGA